jgi:membrane fusion protein (multidrug efflux system)
MQKRMTMMIIALSVVFGGLVVFNVIRSLIMGYFFAHYKPPAVTVSAVTATTKNWQPRLHAVGNFTAINGVNVTSQVAGNVTAIHFQSGQTITANQPLIDIDNRIDQAKLKANQADLELQTINYKRQLELLKTNATSVSNSDEAHAKLLEAEANVEQSLTLIDQKHIIAPFSGQLGLREINLGQYIVPGETNIVTLQSLEPLYVELYLPEQRLSQIHLGQAITASIPPYPRFKFVGTITAINSKADTETHNIKIQATFSNCPLHALKDPLHSTLIQAAHQDNETIRVECNSELNQKNQITEYAFLPGMFADIEIEQAVIPDVLVIPTTAISYSSYGNSVFVIETNAKISTVKQVFVSTGEQQGNEIIITKGLQPGQLVVSTGELKLQNGTPVVINNEIQLSTNTPVDQLSE